MVAKLSLCIPCFCEIQHLWVYFPEHFCQNCWLHVWGKGRERLLRWCVYVNFTALTLCKCALQSIRHNFAWKMENTKKNNDNIARWIISPATLWLIPLKYLPFHINRDVLKSAVFLHISFMCTLDVTLVRHRSSLSRYIFYLFIETRTIYGKNIVACKLKCCTLCTCGGWILFSFCVIPQG